ncbi:small acid-soluble spore protein Tlp [Paenibacillus segetis]|uniref:Small, acid-soluble spore protein Tlp n=1 Tax=Paenibacillus segetis TaxID=1325360 RepID=A0ABQ1YBB0_9BACL|nr:small acid-soluble spore protein Tlp [Paenibacillus segetis]GGH18428.1 small, acid-soluble spore protein Tlp [Paenibacillus segetis]
MAKPDDRSDNVQKLNTSIQKTIENYREGQDYLDEHADEITGEEIKQIEKKNTKRLNAIEGFRAEVEDEKADQQ